MKNNCNHPLLIGVVEASNIDIVTCCKCDEIGKYKDMITTTSKSIFIKNESKEEAYLECFLTKAAFKSKLLDKHNNVDLAVEDIKEKFINQKQLKLI